MGYKGSVAYVQRQIERILRKQRAFARAYVDDIIVFSKTLAEHIVYLTSVFKALTTAGISINLDKAFIGFPSIQFLGQHVDS